MAWSLSCSHRSHRFTCRPPPNRSSACAWHDHGDPLGSRECETPRASAAWNCSRARRFAARAPPAYHFCNHLLSSYALSHRSDNGSTTCQDIHRPETTTRTALPNHLSKRDLTSVSAVRHFGGEGRAAPVTSSLRIESVEHHGQRPPHSHLAVGGDPERHRPCECGSSECVWPSMSSARSRSATNYRTVPLPDATPYLIIPIASVVHCRVYRS